MRRLPMRMRGEWLDAGSVQQKAGRFGLLRCAKSSEALENWGSADIRPQPEPEVGAAMAIGLR
jgi:hypothetical protein